MKPEMLDFLSILYKSKAAGNEWVANRAVKNISTMVRMEAKKRGWVEGQGQTSLRQYRILPLGESALKGASPNTPEIKVAVNEPKMSFAVDANMDMMPGSDHDDTPRGSNREIAALIIPASVQPQIRAIPAPEKNNGALTPLAQVGEHERACAQAIAILSEDWPEVNDLVESLVKLNRRKAQPHE